jgi:hypothetical protein
MTNSTYLFLKKQVGWNRWLWPWEIAVDSHVQPTYLHRSQYRKLVTTRLGLMRVSTKWREILTKVLTWNTRHYYPILIKLKPSPTDFPKILKKLRSKTSQWESMCVLAPKYREILYTECRYKGKENNASRTEQEGQDGEEARQGDQVIPQEGRGNFLPTHAMKVCV